MNAISTLVVEGNTINISNEESGEYISLTGMISWLDNQWIIIGNWLRARSTLEFLNVWEKMNNPNFNSIEFDEIRKEAWLHTFSMSVKRWIERTGAIWIIAKAGRYGGTYAHKDIAFEFASAISPEFKLFLIREYERLKSIENNQYNLERNVNRILAKLNYKVNTDAIKEYIIPKLSERSPKWVAYANEADMLNVAVFWFTKKERCEANPGLCSKWFNPREFASINENLVMSRMEILNGQKIEEWMSKEARFEFLKEKAQKMLNDLNQTDFIRSLKKESPDVYLRLTQPSLPNIEEPML